MSRVKLLINDDWTYEGRPIISCALERFGDLSGDELAIDTLTARLYFDQASHSYYLLSNGGRYICSGGDGAYMVHENIEHMPTKLPRGTKIDLFYDDVFQGTFYLQKADRMSAHFFTITAQSVIGVVAAQTHYGGLYRSVAFSDVLTDILGSFVSFSCEQSLASQRVTGYLPIATRRDNLHQLLLAFGAIAGKDAQGDLYFYIPENTVINVPNSNVYLDGQSTSSDAVNSVRVLEHSYLATPTDAEVVLFDNTDGSMSAQNTFVDFQAAPVYGLTATGNLTIEESGVNYAILSGVGTLKGKVYTHTTRAVEKSLSVELTDTAATAEVGEATLVNILNSENTAERLLKYYASKSSLRISVVNQPVKPGDQIRATDPFGETFTGFIDSTNTVFSKLKKTDCNIITGYSPYPAGNRYTDARVLTGSGSVSFPAGTDEIYAILIGGGTGGQAGGSGNYPETHNHGENGTGGSGGKAGISGRVFAGKIQVRATGETFTYSCGTGGAGGIAAATGQPLGADGTDTVFGPFSTINGQSGQTVQNILYSGSGNPPVYAADGIDGVAGADGGEGGSVTFGGQTWHNGATGESYIRHKAWTTGGFGGGAAVGYNGGDGDDAEAEYSAGNGGSGATPVPGAAPASYGQGGNGGHGGGGGGGGGHDRDSFYGWDGAPGSGSNGGAGGDGCIIIYYKAVSA